MAEKWLSIVGIGEDGLQGLSPIARSLVNQAKVIVGGDRHLAMLPTDDQREKLVWTSLQEIDPRLLKEVGDLSMFIYTQ